MADRNTYYPIAELPERVEVLFPIGPARICGEYFAARDLLGVKLTRGRRNRRRTSFFLVRGDRRAELPRHMHPALFRPRDVATYTRDYDLPKEAAALTPDVDWRSKPPVEVSDDVPAHLDWEGDYNQPGGIGPDEIEVRALRGLKTERAPGVDDKGLYGPRRYGSTLDAMYGREAVAAGWRPDERDIEDWYRVHKWLLLIDPKCRDVIERRSMDYSLRQIAWQLSVHPELVRRLYRSGLAELRKAANRGQ